MSKTVEEAFEEWDVSRLPSKYRPSLDRKAAFAAGVAHGAAEEREAVLAILSTTAPRSELELETLELIERRIRQRGEK